MNEIVLSFDIEWACAEVVADVVRLLEERNLRATFFCTHPGIEVADHERSLHPNFFRDGNTQVAEAHSIPDELEFYRAVVGAARTLCPEATGVRSHRRYYTPLVEQVLRENDLQYDSTAMEPLTPGLAPGWLGDNLLSLPIYFMDHWDLGFQATGFELARLRLDEPGLKVVDFHPNLIFLNAATIGQYEQSRPYYRDPDRLRAARHSGRGVRTLFLDLLDKLAKSPVPLRTLGEINAECRCALTI